MNCRLNPVFQLVAAVMTMALAFAGTSAPASAQQVEIGANGRAMWFEAPELHSEAAQSPDDAPVPVEFQLLQLDEPAFESHLERAPLEYTSAAVLSTHQVALPMPDGSWARFRVEESPILSPELAARYPSIRTYRVQGIDDPGATGRLGFTARGFHAIVFTEQGTVYLSPAREMPSYYRSYWKQDMPGQPFQCHVDDHGHPLADKDSFQPTASRSSASTMAASGDELTTYRLAITATGEYTQFFGGVDDAMDNIVTTINRVTGIYEREVAISFDLVATNIYDDPDDDPFDGTTIDGTLLTQNDNDLDDNVGSDNYDIGHLFSAGGGGGLAERPSVCTSNKGRGATSLSNPSGDVFDVDFVSHEIGHQFDGKHTWNGTSGSCSAGQWASDAAYEPGSGSTIMAYAGICGGQNVQSNSDDYFHTHSFDEITSYRDNGGSCGTVSATGNNAPNVDAGPDFTIPTDTPFTLTATGSDPDGDPITFAWEQFDLGTRDGLPQSTFTNGPLFRSRPGTASPSRTLPRLQDLLDGAATPWEVLPTVERDLTFRVTARDNLTGGGGVDYDTMNISVEGDPFALDRPQTGDALECGADENLFWQVGGGSVASDVAARLSVDGGGAFSTLIASTPNIGMANATIPTTLTDDGWLKLDAIDNIFFALSGPFSIDDTLDPGVTAPGDTVAECAGHAGTSVSLGDPAISDLCDASPAVSNDAPALFQLGSTTVIWEATDASANAGTDEQVVTIEDTIAPDITAPADVVAECTSADGTPVALGEPNVSDICDADPAVGNNAPALFPKGETTVTWTAQDGSSNTGVDAQTVRVEDTTAPEVVDPLEISTTSLWPSNHRLVSIDVGVVGFEDACDTDPVVFCSVRSSEPPNANGNGDGNTDFDIVFDGEPIFTQGTGPIEIDSSGGSGTFDLELRAERSARSTGREYTIECYALDNDANRSGSTVALVTVPHNRNSM